MDRNRDPVHGLIQVGADPFRLRVGDVGYDRIRRYPSHGRYPHGHYYDGYRPFYYPGCNYYSPFVGYAYSTVYLTQPYVMHVYDEPTVYTTTTYADSGYSQPVASAPPAPTYDPQANAIAPMAAPVDTAKMPSEVREGNAAFAAGRFDEARRLYVRAVMADERDGYAKMLYAWSNFALGDYAVAAASMRRALLTTPDLVDYPMDVRTMYADPAVLSGQTSALHRYVQEFPGDREAQMVLAYLLYSIGEPERGANLFNVLVDRDQGDTVVALVRDACVRAAKGQAPPPQP